MKNKILLFVMMLFCLGCKLVIDDGGISTERDVMIYEAGQVTPYP